MAAQWLICNSLIALLILFLAPHLSKSDDSSFPRFYFSWMDDDDDFFIGDTATINVKVTGNYTSEEHKDHPFNPDILVNNTKGNSSYINELYYNFPNYTKNWQILFKPIAVGFFNVLITEEHYKVYDASFHFLASPADSYVPPHFSFTWPDNKMDFKAGELVTIKPTVYDNFNTKQYKHHFNPFMTLSNSIGQNEKTGNSSYITGVYNTVGNDTNKFLLHFIPIMVGLFHIWIHQENLGINSASMHFTCTPAEIYLPGGIVSWMDDTGYYEAGEITTVMILPKDAFGNTVTLESEVPKTCNFTVYATHLNGSDARVVDVSQGGWNGDGYLTIDFTVITSGTLLLHVKHENSDLNGSPLTFEVDPGPLDVGNCVAEWHTETKAIQLLSTLETFITQRDRFGNLVPRFYDFDFEVIDKGTGLALPIGDLRHEEVVPGIQSFSFKGRAPGVFLLFVRDKFKKNLILNMPYEFTVFIAYCDGVKSIVNGSGLQNSVAGQVSKFTIVLKDAYEYPSPLEQLRLRVQITLPSLSLHVEARISPINSTNGTLSTGMDNFGAFDPTSVYSQSDDGDDEPWKRWKSAFEVEYVAQKSGWYEIRVFCGNVPLNDGNPFTKFVAAGEANASTSRVFQFKKQAASLVTHGVDLQLMDSFYNPVVLSDSQMSKLKMESRYLPMTVILYINNKDGTYTIFYMPMVIDIYDLCTFYDGGRINPCPFVVTTFEHDSFPEAYGDVVSCWEDESIGFYPLANDHIVNGKGKIYDYQKPRHGSIVVYGDDVIRYTPYKRYYGIDSFTYRVLDANGIFASALVNVSVLTIPPQFVTFPAKLQAYEDTLSPKFGGFSGFEITYADSKENISVAFSAQNGSVFLSPLLIQLWDPMWNQLSITKTEDKNKELILTARTEVINFAIQSLKYIGFGNFSGEDIIRVSTINKNTKRDLDIPVIVTPINDPPFINAPDFIMLGNVTEDEGFLLFDTQRDNFTLSVGDPDLLHFPRNKSYFRVMLSVEVSSGYFTTNLPAVVISTTELKLKNSNQWQPLQTFVEISKHVTVKAKAIRFRGTIDICNTFLQQLLYFAQGDEQGGGVLKRGGVLKLSVNDLGWYGCYPDCSEMMSAPLVAEATIKLVTKTPVDVVVAHSLGSLIVIESIVLTSLAVMLIFFTCKCVILLLHKKVINQNQFEEFQRYMMQNSHEYTSSTDSSEHMTELPGSSLANPLHEESGLK